MFVFAWLACGPAAPIKDSPPPETAPAAAAHPALVVELVFDQLPIRLFDAAAPFFVGPLAKLNGPEAFRANARHHHAITFTCPGHATLSTGASPSVSGIVSNDWWPRGRLATDAPDSLKETYCADISFLRVGTLADRVVEAGGKVVSLSNKDRAAMMMGGAHATVTGYLDKDTMKYKGNAPWLGLFDVEPYLDRPWGEPLHPTDYAAKYPDDQPWETEIKGLGTKFPHGAARDGGFNAFRAHPASGDALADLAAKAVKEADLGTDDKPDLLAVSFSEVDYVGHAFTSESWEALDNLGHLDKSLESLFAVLDAQVGAGKWTVVLSSDHGSIPAKDAPHVPSDAVENAANQALAAAGVPGKVAWEEPFLWLPEDIRADAAKRAPPAKAVAAAVSQVPGLAGAYAWRDGGLPDDVPHAAAIRLSLDNERSGDVVVILAPHTLYDVKGNEGHGTSHGTPYDEDQLVPFRAWGAGIQPGNLDEVDTRQIAPTLARLMGVQPPDHAEQPPISAALK
jgi:predicted AlkP superfamily pyrophosphatase or phosphodiesterase